MSSQMGRATTPARTSWLTRRVGVWALLTSCVGILAHGSAVGFQSGYMSGAGSYGTRATVNGTQSGIPGGAGVIATVRLQSGGAGDQGLIQYGHVKQGGGYTSDCGGPGTIGYMLEWKNVGGTYLCTAFFGSFGSSQLFELTRSATVNQWLVKLNGAQVTNRNLNWGSGISMSPAEWNGPSPGVYSFFWTTWQRQTAVGNPYGVITSTQTFSDNGVFKFSGTPPTFRIYS